MNASRSYTEHYETMDARLKKWISSAQVKSHECGVHYKVYQECWFLSWTIISKIMSAG
jgi:hypothetical protein